MYTGPCKITTSGQLQGQHHSTGTAEPHQQDRVQPGEPESTGMLVICPPGKGREAQRKSLAMVDWGKANQHGLFFLQRNLCIMKKIIAVVEAIFRGTDRHVQTHRASLGQPDLQASRIYQLGVGRTAIQHKVDSCVLSVTGKRMEGTPHTHPAM